jgi:leukotriene-A4 hydrolase
VYKPGLAPVPLDFSTPKFNEANDLAKAWIDAKGEVPAGADAYL